MPAGIAANCEAGVVRALGCVVEAVAAMRCSFDELRRRSETDRGAVAARLRASIGKTTGRELLRIDAAARRSDREHQHQTFTATEPVETDHGFGPSLTGGVGCPASEPKRRLNPRGSNASARSSAIAFRSTSATSRRPAGASVSCGGTRTSAVEMAASCSFDVSTRAGTSSVACCSSRWYRARRVDGPRLQRSELSRTDDRSPAAAVPRLLRLRQEFAVCRIVHRDPIANRLEVAP